MEHQKAIAYQRITDLQESIKTAERYLVDVSRLIEGHKQGNCGIEIIESEVSEVRALLTWIATK